MSKTLISIATIEKRFSEFQRSNRALVADGHMSQTEANIIDGLGALMRGLAENNREVSEIEYMALLLKAQDFGKLLCGAVDQAKGIESPRASYYKRELIPYMLELVSAGALQDNVEEATA